MYQKGLRYRDFKPVYFSPSSETALTEAELEYDETLKSPSLYFRCEILNSSNICGFENQAICYNKDLKYYLVRIKGNNFIICDETVENLHKELETEIEIVKSH